MARNTLVNSFAAEQGDLANTGEAKIVSIRPMVGVDPIHYERSIFLLSIEVYPEVRTHLR